MLNLVYSIEEAAAELRISKKYMYQLVNSGEIEAIRAGRRILVLREALEEFVQNAPRVA